jgi:transitional endoplasmic reticulum ATPase
MSSDVERNQRNSLESEYLEHVRQANKLVDEEKPEAAVSSLKQAIRTAAERARCARSDADAKEWCKDAQEDLTRANELSDDEITLDELSVELLASETGTGGSASENDGVGEIDDGEIPEVSFDDIGGLEQQKQQIREAVEWPLRYSKTLEENGIDAPTGVLTYGEPGTGKTLLAKAVANESEAAFFHIKGPEVFNKWLGKSEEAIREAFEEARGCDEDRAVLYFDELDSIAVRRGTDSNEATNRVVNQLLTELDGLEETGDLVVIGSTNRPDMLDEGLTRPGRFGSHLRVPRPDAAARREILETYMREKPVASDVNLDVVVEVTDNFTGSDLEHLANEVGIRAMRRVERQRDVSDPFSFRITPDDFVAVLSDMTPSGSAEIRERCDAFEAKQG